ncbi:MAG: carbamoyltransferase C-terminal domain-containing protein [Planctomycetota bacterium]|nr:carbamoyltransferase C-terminal domain-containing protein [Planctomycetota bacterium]
MGLAAHGSPTYKEAFQWIIQVRDDGSFALDPSYFSYSRSGSRMYSSKLIKLLGPPREPESELTERHCDIAATLQHVLEEAMIKMVRHLTKLTGLKKLCMAGGIGLNCVANGKILEQIDVEELFVQPASGDDGGAIGAPLFLYHQVLGNTDRKSLDTYYLGPEYSQIYTRSILKRQENAPIQWEELDDEELIGRTAAAIKENRIIGWFQGRMEFGPRALGARSILANPCNPDMKDILNHRVKKRESFRPFAPAVLADRAADYFSLKQPSPYMLIAASVKEEARDRVPAITHVDNTARIQTVTPDTNPLFFKLLEKLGEVNGEPMVLNTSFNLRGEPIVCTPENALSCFFGTKIDVLVMNDFWIEKRKQQGG